ncbi:MAG TPA: rhomboid family intramembrane serine protease [Fibrobacteria bacterium]|jgi:membrane associated rhomboid family serine protease|nr:rhomboid family intramembrane serine protease [Fibrobacteria bacterium]
MPLVIRVLLTINIVAFLVDKFTGGAFLQAWLALNTGAVLHDHQWWRVFTYMFLHDTQNIWHIAFNMLSLWMFGTPVAREMGESGFLRLYLIAGFVAGLCSLAFYGMLEPYASVVGASGAIYALLVAFAWFYPEQRLLMFFFFPVPARYAVLILGGISLLLINSTGVAHVAHLGGAVFAWVYLKWFWAPSRGGFLAQWRQRRNRNRWEKAMRDGERLREAMEDIDPILRKISESGINSLTRSERKRLDSVSEMKKKLHGSDLPISDYYRNR